MGGTSAVRSAGFWLRVVQLVFGIIAFAPIAEASGYSRVDYAIFCGVVTMIASLALMACLLLGISAVKGLPSLVYDALFCVFWLGCAAALSDSLASLNGAGWYGSGKSRLEASVAFSWLTWFAFIGSVVCDALDMRGGAGASTWSSSSSSAAQPPVGAAGAKGGAPTGAAVATSV